MQFEPLVLESKTLEHLWETKDLNMFAVHGYDIEIPACSSIEELGQFLKTYHQNWIKTQLRNHLDNGLKKQIVNNDLDLYTLLILGQQPQVVQDLEYKWCLPRTGNITDMLRHYRDCYYTYSTAFDPQSRYRKIIAHSARWRHMDVLRYHLSQPDSWQDIYISEYIKSAVKGGDLEIVQLIYRIAAKKYTHVHGFRVVDMVSNNAAQYGHLEILQWIQSVASVNLSGVLDHAMRGRHAHIVDYILETQHDKIDMRELLKSAAMRSDVRIVRYVLKELSSVSPAPAATYNEAVVDVICSLGQYNKEILELLLPHANDYNEFLNDAATFGHLDLVERMIGLGANSYNRALRDMAHGAYNQYADRQRYKEISVILLDRIPDLEVYIREYHDNDPDDFSFEMTSRIYQWVMAYKQNRNDRA